MVEGKKKTDLITVISIGIAAFTIYLQIFPPKDPVDQARSVIYFVAILGYLGLLYIASWFTEKVKLYTNKINENAESINKIREEIETNKRLSELDKRVSILEKIKGNKRGSIDPKWILLIILLLLFYLYLRSIGLLK